METTIIQWLQSSDLQWLDSLMLFFTGFGDTLFLVIVGGIVLYAFGKKQAFWFFIQFFCGLILVSGLKNIIKRPRPYTKKGIQSIGEPTSGYAMPSGHSYTIANLSAQGIRACHHLPQSQPITQRELPKNLSPTDTPTIPQIPTHKTPTSDGIPPNQLSAHPTQQKKLYAQLQKTMTILGIVLTILVAVSRVYLGQHYPTDTIISILIAVSLSITLPKVWGKLANKECAIALILASIALIVLVVASILAVHNSQLIIICAATTGWFGGYYLETRWIKYDSQSSQLNLPSTDSIQSPPSSNDPNSNGTISTQNQIKKAIYRTLLGGLSTLTLFIILTLLFPPIPFLQWIRYLVTTLWATLGTFWLFKKLNI